MIRRPPRSTQSRSSAASDVYKRQPWRARSVRAAGRRDEDLWTGDRRGRVRLWRGGCRRKPGAGGAGQAGVGEGAGALAPDRSPATEQGECAGPVLAVALAGQCTTGRCGGRGGTQARSAGRRVGAGERGGRGIEGRDGPGRAPARGGAVGG